MPATSITAGQLLGHYRILERIGGGGQGEVFRAHDERFDKDVALKILPATALSDDAARKQFRQEALAVGKLNHPNIATAFYFGEEHGVDFLVTEYISGSGLDEKVKHGPLPEERVLALGAQLANGLEAAHHEGIIHRDLKPGNLRITESGRLKILDFGLAELIDPVIDIEAAETVTLSMTLTGTVPYMAPEQFEGMCDQRSDLWAAGVVLYEMATGQRPFPEAQLQRLKDAILHRQPARPAALNPAISQGLESIILRALEKDPKKRYQTAAELRDDLTRVMHGWRVKRRGPTRSRASALAFVIVLLGASVLLARYYWPTIRTILWPSTSVATPNYRVLAVLPTESASQNAEEAAFGRGVAETVSARIAQGTNSRQIQLIPPTELSSQGVKSAEAAQREFGVDLVLSIGLQRSGDKIRITCSLIDPKSHLQLNARTVTGDANDLFGLEDSAVNEVLGMLPEGAKSGQPTPSEVQAAVPPGYEYYVRGQGYLLEYQKLENIDSAIKEFQHALQASAHYAPAYAGLGEAYWRGYKANRGKDWLDQARTNCEKALETDPRLAVAHTCLGNLYNDTGHYSEAVQEFQRALSLDSEDAAALGGLGLAYELLGNTNEAEATYQKAITLRPQYWAVYNWLGNFYYDQARYADAAVQFQKVIQLRPDNNRGYYNLGAMYLLEGNYNDAIAASNRSIELQPTAAAYSNLGTAYYYLRRYPEAIAAYEKARAVDEKDYLNWGNFGDALYWSSNRRPEAATAYKRAIALAQERVRVNAKDATARAYIAGYSAMLGDKRTALAELQKASSLAPKDPDVMFRAALVYNKFGDQNQTLEWLKKASSANYSRTTMRDTPDFDQLQSNPEFKAIIAGK